MYYMVFVFILLLKRFFLFDLYCGLHIAYIVLYSKGKFFWRNEQKPPGISWKLLEFEFQKRVATRKKRPKVGVY